MPRSFKDSKFGRLLFKYPVASVFAGLLVLSACTMNYYDYSTHPAGSSAPDTVFVEPGSGSITVPPAVQPDTVFSRYPLLGGGNVEIEECENWSRSTLVGCKTETDGIAFEMRPVIISHIGEGGNIEKEFYVEFICKMQPGVFDSENERTVLSDGITSSTPAGLVMPVITGTEVVTIVANVTSFPFLAEQSESYQGDLLADGTLLYEAVFSLPMWMLRDICSAQQLVVSSESPGFRMMFSDGNRRLLQQFFDIFVIHNGEAPVLPVGQ